MIRLALFFLSFEKYSIIPSTAIEQSSLSFLCSLGIEHLSLFFEKRGCTIFSTFNAILLSKILFLAYSLLFTCIKSCPKTISRHQCREFSICQCSLMHLYSVFAKSGDSGFIEHR